MTTVTFKQTKVAETMGEYKETAIDTRKATADILVKYANGGSFTVQTNGIELNGRGVKATYSNGAYEVTTNKLEQLSKTYKVETDF